MQILIICCMIAMISGAFLLSGCNQETVAGGENKPAAPITASVAGGKSAEQTEIRKALQKLANSQPPKSLAPGAMCYDMAMPPDRAEYVCPTCGEKTLYAVKGGDRKVEQWGTQKIQYGISTCRRLVQTIKGLDVALDESEFCRKCSPDTQDPALILVVIYEGAEKPHRARDIGANDLKLLAEFMSGSKVHKGETDNETPLKDHLPRLQELLGVKLKL